ncbi:20252_t:CDS:2 [Gigaspora rosea]|nr:20252_t:CDS:2 [Gigaspora rosea]
MINPFTDPQQFKQQLHGQKGNKGHEPEGLNNLPKMENKDWIDNSIENEGCSSENSSNWNILQPISSCRIIKTRESISRNMVMPLWYPHNDCDNSRNNFRGESEFRGYN